MSMKIKIKRGFKEKLPTLDEGELGLCIDTNEVFIGTQNGNALFATNEEITALENRIDNLVISGGGSVVEGSLTNGYIEVNGSEVQVYDDTTITDEVSLLQQAKHTHPNQDELDRIGVNDNNKLTVDGVELPSGSGESIVTFNTLADLQTAYPNGLNQPVWIISEKEWYYWSAEADVTAPVVSVSPLGGSYASSQSVTLSANEAASIYYTLDGSTPTTSSSVYTSPIAINVNKTLKYFAVDTAGNQSSVQTVAYVIDTTPPNDVTNLITSNITSTSVTLSWTASNSPDIASYEVYNGATLLNTVTGTTYNVSGLSAQTQYTFTVKAKDNLNNVSTGVSIIETTTNVADTTPPADVTNLTTSSVTSTSLTLSWTASVSTDIAEYDVYNGVTLLTTITGTSYNVTGLSSSTAYTFNVIARDGSGNESVGNSVNVSTLAPADTTPPNDVTNLVAAPSETTVDLSWTASTSTDVASYDVFNGANLLGNVTGTTYQAAGLSSSTQYTFSVKAKDGSGNVSSGTSISITTNGQPVVNSVINAENGNLSLPINSITWGKHATFSDANYTTISTSALSTTLFNLTSPSTMLNNGIQYVPYASLGSTNGECYTINSNCIYFKTSVSNGSDVSGVLSYFSSKFGDLKLTLNPSYGTYSITSNISNVSTRAATNGGQYFKCKLDDGLGSYPGGDKKQFNSLGYFMQPDYSWTHATFNVKINADATLEMVVPSGTLSAIDQANVSSYLNAAKIKIFY